MGLSSIYRRRGIRRIEKSSQSPGTPCAVQVVVSACAPVFVLRGPDSSPRTLLKSLSENFEVRACFIYPKNARIGV
jgi:hypothetical protein